MDVVDHGWMGARPTNPGEPVQDRRLIVLTSRGIVLVFTKEGEGLLGDVPGVTLASVFVGGVNALEAIAGAPLPQDRIADTLKEKPSKFDLRSVIKVDIPAATEVKSLVAYGKVQTGWSHTHIHKVPSLCELLLHPHPHPAPPSPGQDGGM
jgi:hypothetical protein